MGWKLTHADGRRSSYHVLYAHATRRCREEYGDATFGPMEGDEGHERVLVWANECESQNDSGGRAVAKIERENET